MNGKGDTPRPPSVPASMWVENWDRTFGAPCPYRVVRDAASTIMAEKKAGWPPRDRLPTTDPEC